MDTKRIILADDQLLVRAGIKALLDTLSRYAVIAECAEGQQAVDVTRRFRPDMVILDIDMPGLCGIAAARQIHQFDPGIKILILSAIDRQEVVDQALNAGASGYLYKDFILDELRLSLDTILGGGIFLSPHIRERLSPLATASALTPRQTEILRMVASGLTTKEMARTLGISPKTVEFHRAQVMDRIGVRDVAGLTRYALQQGMIA